MASKEEQVRKVIVCGRNENPDLSVRKLAKKLGFPASTVHNVLKSFDTRSTTARKAGSGTKTDLSNHRKDAKVKRILQKRPDLSVHTVVRQTKKKWRGGFMPLGGRAGKQLNSRGLSSSKEKKIRLRFTEPVQIND